MQLRNLSSGSKQLSLFEHYINDIVRGKWFIAYTVLLFALIYAVLMFSFETSQAVVGVMNLVIFIVPAVGLFFTSMYYYSRREFMEFILSQPVSRTFVYFSFYMAMTLAMIFSFILGVSVPMFIQGFIPEAIKMSLWGVLLNMIFVAISLMVSVLTDDRVRGLGTVLLLWFFFTIFYDAVLTAIIIYFRDYPIEKFIPFVIAINPVDDFRISTLLSTDIAAMLGYSGAVIKHFFGRFFGVLYVTFLQALWVVVPFLVGLWKFRKKDF